MAKRVKLAMKAASTTTSRFNAGEWKSFMRGLLREAETQWCFRDVAYVFVTEGETAAAPGCRFVVM
ncbi:hypothetical protein GCM10017790_76580 [Amycolatopsis oliviviridis]|uniref:Transposase n=1 Tax=Amycolatopsis oliviviridis TaxID=1471590 RepID=A0ABQ3M915_9PSEU|nr:hypothetical protein GCM10017790_76580 [Amycolatopsis oliviviridis]